MGREEAEAIFAQVIQTVRACWQGAMGRAGVSAADRETVRSAFLPPPYNSCNAPTSRSISAWVL